jgi:hypothetical protein
MDVMRAARTLKCREQGIISISYRPARAEYSQKYETMKKLLAVAKQPG